MAAPKPIAFPDQSVPLVDPSTGLMDFRWYAPLKRLERRNVGDPNAIDSLVVGAPTDGDKGPGTINAEELWEDGHRAFIQRGNATEGLEHTVFDLGTKSSGTLTINPLDGFFQKVINGGAFTLSPISTTFYGSIVLHITNNGSAGAITHTGWTRAMPGDSLTTTNALKYAIFMFFYGANGADYMIKARQ